MTDKEILETYTQLYSKAPSFFGSASFNITLSDISTEYINSLRRALIDESDGYALDINKSHQAAEDNRKHTTEVHMLMSFLDERISQIPLRQIISKDIVERLKYRLEVENYSASNMYVFAGDLVPYGVSNPPMLFEPFHIIAEIQPGKRLKIGEINILHGKGNAQFHLCRHVWFKPLDIEEYEYEEVSIRKPDGTDAPHGYESGFKVSCCEAVPRKYIMGGKLCATEERQCHSDIKILLKRACESINDRLRKIISVVSDQNTKGIGSRHGIQYTTVKLQSGDNKARLVCSSTTETVGELISYAVLTMNKNVAVCNYEISSETIIINIEYKNDISSMLLKSIENVIRDFINLSTQIDKL